MLSNGFLTGDTYFAVLALLCTLLFQPNWTKSVMMTQITGCTGRGLFKNVMQTFLSCCLGARPYHRKVDREIARWLLFFVSNEIGEREYAEEAIEEYIASHPCADKFRMFMAEKGHRPSGRTEAS
jgi:hypothetical protein